jgi:hypothetical protein
MPPPLPDIRALAVRQWRDYRLGTPGTYFGEEHVPLHLSDAYRQPIDGWRHVNRPE